MGFPRNFFGLCFLAMCLKAEIARAFVLSGQITNGTNGVSGVSVAAGTNVTTTDVNGFYSFTNLTGTFLVTPSKTGQVFNPLRQALTMPPGLSNINFVQGTTNIATIVATCDRPSLAAAVALGGLIEFGCNGDLLVTNQLSVATNLVLDGTNHQVVLDGGGKAEIVVVTATNVTVGLNNLIVSNSSGSAIWDIHSPPTAGVLNISGCTFVNNQSDAGGAIMNSVTLNVANSTFIGNGYTIPFGVPQAYGGAIFNQGKATITGSTFATNTIFSPFSATAQGGAIDNESGGNLVLVNCTLVGNYVDDAMFAAAGVVDGTAVYNNGGTVALTNCTFAGNLFARGGENPSVLGNGPYVSGQFALRACAFGQGNSVIFDNNQYTSVTDAGYNIAYPPLGGGGFSNATSRTATDPLLGPLADNGGPTLTCSLLPGSPAIDAITNGYYPPTDQRGFTRPYGQAADIGASEHYPSNFTITSLTGTGTNWQIQGNGFPLTTYLLQTSADLTNWSSAQTNMTGPNGLFNALDPANGAPRRFYRTSLP